MGSPDDSDVAISEGSEVMAIRFLKVDLSPAAGDFEQVALEPGIPLLDRNGGNQQVLRQWLGRLVAEPEWNGAEVSFFVCDDQGRRPHHIRCEPVTTDELKKVKGLRTDFDTLKRRLRELREEAKDPKDAKLLRALEREFATANLSGTRHFDCYFFKYLDRGAWRLVWCWGYQRKDMEPAPAAICTNPSCHLLFVRRQEGNGDCPDCAARQSQPSAAGKAAARPRSKRKLVALVCLVALLAGTLGYMAREWLKDPALVSPSPSSSPSLVAMPATWEGPAGSQFEFRVVRDTANGDGEDVTDQVVPVSENPKIVRIEPGGARMLARSQGRTAIHFYLGDQHAHATIEVQPARNPESIQLEPAELTLGVGSTAQLRVHADLGDGKRVDITDVAEWEPVTDPNVSCHAGQLEGLVPGQATVVARYRATPEDPYRTAQAGVQVVDENYADLELAINPSTLREGSLAELTVSLANHSDQRRSALNSSLLTLEVDDSTLAAVEGQRLRGLKAGKGNLTATFGDLTVTSEFTVESDLTGRFVVSPADLRIMVGESAELQVSSASSAPVRVESSAPEVVAVIEGTNVVGRAPGRAELTVAQEARIASVEVEVTAADLASIAFVPERISVPVDRSVPLRLVAQTTDDQQFELASEAVVWEEIPQASIAELDVKKLELLGRRPTGDAPQALVARVGDQRAQARVDVVPGPLRIELTPEGVVNVPVGQTTQLHAWARYGDGTRAEVDPSRIQWQVSPADSPELRFDTDTATVRAIGAGGTLTVGATYHGFASNRVDFRAITRDFSIALNADRELILVGDRGRFRVAVEGPSPSPSLWGTQFTSSSPELLEVDPLTGQYRALGPGSVTVTAQNEHAQSPALLEVQILPREEAQLVVRPEKLKLMVNARQPLELWLVSASGEEKLSLVGQTAPRVAIGRPGAVHWRAPNLSGVRPEPPFEISIEHAGKSARAVVEVVAGEGPIRIRPEQARLSPGQALSPSVEQQVTGNEQWQELDPALIVWDVPGALRWTPADNELRPQLTPTETAAGSLLLKATYAGKEAEMRIEVDGQPPPNGPLDLVREPEGEEVPVDTQQRYTIVVQRNGEPLPAVGVQWQRAFENDYVRWNPPVLTAKRPGHEQVLNASVGEEDISFVARTVPTVVQPREPLPPPGGVPAEVRIVTDQPQPITLPVRSRFSSFRVEAVYPDRPPADVTRAALLRVVAEDASPAAIAVVGSRVVAQSPGEAQLQAIFNGVESMDPLRFHVGQPDLTGITVSPESLRLGVGESVTLGVDGYTGSSAERHSIGDIGLLSELEWVSDQPEVVKVDGPTWTGLRVGQATVTVSVGSASARVEVTVVETTDVQSDQLIVSPEVLRLRVGESKWLGRDVTVRRGAADLSDQLEAASSAPEVLRYHQRDRSFEALTPGTATIALTAGGRSISLPVVIELGDELDGRIVVEPGSAMLVVGEYLPLRVLLVSDTGQSIDRTGSAILESSDAAVVSVSRNRITGGAAGEATITARLPGIAEPGQAEFRVVAEQFTSLHVAPSPLNLAVGGRRPLRVEAVGPAGRRLLGEHADLRIVPEGAEPGVVELQGGDVRGVSPGNVTLSVQWQGLQAPPVPVEVTDVPIRGLRIDPPTAQVTVAERARFDVYAQRGDAEQLITVEDGLQVEVGDTSVAMMNPDLSVRGLTPGLTNVTAQLGARRATAQLAVVPDSGRDRAADMGPGLRFIPDVLTMQLGIPGTTVRLVNVSPDGTVEDLDHRAEFAIQPEEGKEVLTVQWTARGPVFVAKKPGGAEVRARYANLTTRRPLKVVVVDPNQSAPNQGPPRLEVVPDPLRLVVGKRDGFQRVRLVSPGTAPIDVDYRIESSDDRVVAVENQKRLRAVSAGEARVKVRPVGVPSPLSDVSADVTVYISEPPPPTPKGSRLVLKGPSRATVGAPAQFRVEVSSDGQPQDVTHEGAELVISEDQSGAASVQPGCVLLPHQPATLTIQARYKDLVSNRVTLNVSSPARKEDFVRLEIEVGRQPLALGERRPYTLWGYPPANASRQNLTHLSQAVGSERQEGPRVAVRAKSGFDPGIVGHDPPNLVAKSPGRFVMQAEYGGLRSPTVDLEISDGPLPQLELLTEPTSVTIRGGQQMPSIQVIAKSPGIAPRMVDADWSSEDESIIAADPGNPGRFIGGRVGQTRLVASFQGAEAAVEVTVQGDAFEKVVINEEPNYLPGNRFNVTVLVTSNNPPGSTMEYRIVTAGQSEGSDWKSVPDGPGQPFQLSSPPVKRGPDDTRYHLEIEARDEQQQVVARYPVNFRLNVKIQPQSTSGAR